MPSVFDIAAVFFVLVAAIGVINTRWLRMPHSVGVVMFSVAVAGFLLATEHYFPDNDLPDVVEAVLHSIDFRSTLMNGLLAFLLFASALHVDAGALAARRWPITIMATMGVVVSTVAVGTMCAWAWGGLGLAVPLVVCLVFGALISPTDPIAVLAVLATVKAPDDLRADVSGESLFNDGVAIVAFSAMLALAATDFGLRETPLHPLFILWQSVREVAGGAALGFLLGWLTILVLRPIDDHPVEIMATLALVTGLSAIGHLVHVSVAVAAVSAGLLVGNHGVETAMSDKTRRHLLSFWGTLDEILNSALFVLLGLELVVLTFRPDRILAATVAIPVVLAARLVSVSASVGIAHVFGHKFPRGTMPVLTWGGLRGALSVALVLSLPPSHWKNLLVVVTWVVCVVSIVLQGATIKTLIGVATRIPAPPPPPQNAA